MTFIEECKVDNVTVLQESAGYPLLPEYPYQKAIMLLGFGGQGKSVFSKIIIMILGTDNTSAKTLQSLMGEQVRNQLIVRDVSQHKR